MTANLKKFLQLSCVLSLVVICGACAPTVQAPDYTLYQRHMPRTVLILPPLNATAELMATQRAMSALTYPVAEMGYYPLPVSIVDQILRENGAPSPIEMRQLSRQKLHDLFGADALLDVTIEEWSTKYAVLTSVAIVRLNFSLVDLATGATLWSGKGAATDQPNSNSGGLAGMIASSLVHAAMSTALPPHEGLAAQAAMNGLMVEKVGLLPGPRAPREEEK